MNGWKITAIVLMITQMISILLFVLLISMGSSMINAELKCSEEVCYNIDNAMYYDFNDDTFLCQCMDNNDNVIYQELIE